ncbi:unnamed protein product [Rhodiola kirilowii]
MEYKANQATLAQAGPGHAQQSPRPQSSHQGPIASRSSKRPYLMNPPRPKYSK